MRRTKREEQELRAIAEAISGRELASQDPATRPLPGIVALAAALWLGSAIGTSGTGSVPDAAGWGLALVACAGVVAILRRFAIRRSRLPRATPLALAAVAAALLGGGWSMLRVESDRLSLERIRNACHGERTVARIEGVVASPARGRPAGDRLHAFFRQPADASIELLAESIGPADEAWHASIEGRVLVRLREGAAPWQVGDRLALTGVFMPDRPATNPGARETDFATLDSTWLGVIEVPDPRLVSVLAPEIGAAWRLTRLRDQWRQRTRALLDRMLGHGGDGGSRDLLRALLLGDRRRGGYADLREEFAAAGLSHFLAISGFNLAVVAGVAAVAARILGVRPRRRGLVVIAAIALYLVALPTQLPVLRAWLSATLLAIGTTGARRWDGRAATAIAAIALLSFAPGESVRPGFQLSFAAVLSLQELAPRLRRRWFGEPDRLGRSTRSILASRGADAAAACVAAWAISTPIALHHFGMAAILGVPATLLATPLVAATVSAAAITMPLAAIAPGTEAIFGSTLMTLADAILAIARTIGEVPHASWRPDPPSAAATAIVLFAMVAWLAAPRGRASLAACCLVGSIVAIATPTMAHDRLIEATFLDVGDGTAIVVRRGSSAALLDVGSVGDRRVGGSTAVRAIESLGARRLEAVFTSHPNLDHCSGLIEVLARHREARWFVGEAFIAAARRSPEGPEAAALDWAARLGRVPCIVSAGDRVEAGGLAIRCLHPPPGASLESANDASLVLRVDPIESSMSSGCDPAPRPILLSTGDLEPRGLAQAGEAIDALDPWIAEVPHHGSATIETARLMLAKPRTIWVQSTGRRRLEPDTLGTLLEAGRDGDLPRPIRLITARDGAISARVDLEGSEPRTVSLARHAGRWRAVIAPAR